MLRPGILLAAAALAAGPAWAQAEQAAKAADALMQQGLPGAMIVILGCAIVYLCFALRSAWQARLDDGQAANRELIEVNKTSAEALRASAEKLAQLANSVDAASRGAEERWHTLGDLLAVLTPIQASIAAINSSLVRIEADTRNCSRGGP